MAEGGYAGYRERKEILLWEEKEGKLNKLCKLIKEVESDLILYKTDQAEKAYQIVFERSLTAIFIMLVFDRNGDSEGLDFIHTIKRIDCKAFIPVIVITKEELSLKHFLGELHCFGILDAEYEEAYARRLIQEALRYPAVAVKKEFAYFRNFGNIHRIRISDILYTEHHRGGAVVHTHEGKVEIGACSCRNLLDKLEAFHFMICARGIIVNMASVERIDTENHRLYFAGGEKWAEYGADYSIGIVDCLMKIGIL